LLPYYRSFSSPIQQSVHPKSGKAGLCFGSGHNSYIKGGFKEPIKKKPVTRMVTDFFDGKDYDF